jgi:hypothetical protein
MMVGWDEAMVVGIHDKCMYNLYTAARYSKYKTQLKHNIIQ